MDDTEKYRKRNRIDEKIKINICSIKSSSTECEIFQLLQVDYHQVTHLIQMYIQRYIKITAPVTTHEQSGTLVHLIQCNDSTQTK